MNNGVLPRDSWNGIGGSIYINSVGGNKITTEARCNLHEAGVDRKLKVPLHFVAEETLTKWKATCIETGTSLVGNTRDEAFIKCIERLLVILNHAEFNHPNEGFTEYFHRKGIKVSGAKR